MEICDQKAEAIMEKIIVEATKDKYKKIGDILENGYTIIMTNGKYVLAYKEIKEEFATWFFNTMGSTDWGHYFPHWTLTKEEAFKLAVDDYINRQL